MQAGRPADSEKLCPNFSQFFACFGIFYNFPRAPDRNGYIGHTWALPIEDRGFVRGGNEYEFLQPVRPDDRVTVTWRLVELFERPSARGEPLLFVVSEARYTNQRGELLAVNRETNIHA